MDPEVNEVIDLLEEAAQKLKSHFDGKNKRGLVTNILNSIYEIKKYKLEKEDN
jgi:hypothetical protein